MGFNVRYTESIWHAMTRIVEFSGIKENLKRWKCFKRDRTKSNNSLTRTESTENLKIWQKWRFKFPVSAKFNQIQRSLIFFKRVPTDECTNLADIGQRYKASISRWLDVVGKQQLTPKTTVVTFDSVNSAILERGITARQLRGLKIQLNDTLPDLVSLALFFLGAS